jgi:nicotinamide-nucleotide amidase
MKATVITIGDEILIGQTIDTNSAWIGQELNKMGVKLYEIISVSDNAEHIVSALDKAKAQGQIVLITGGLGPTKDDITKATIIRYFNTELQFHEDLWQKMVEIFEKRGKAVLEMNRSQAMYPANCTVIPNERGTAQGMWFDIDGVVYMSMPGVPHEMKHIMTKYVLPKLLQRFSFPKIVHRTIMTAGAGESQIATQLKEFEEKLPAHVKLAYLPELGVVKLRLTASGEGKEVEDLVDTLITEMKNILGKLVYADTEKRLEEVLGEMMLERKAMLALAESCTGGYTSYLITSVAGSSQYYAGSIVSYSYDLKERILGVNKETLATYGAVSEQTVIEMVTGLLKTTNADYGVSISGIAGPGGATPDKPVGTVWIAVADKDRVVAKQFKFFPSRLENIKVFANAALNMLRLFMLGKLS